METLVDVLYVIFFILISVLILYFHRKTGDYIKELEEKAGICPTCWQYKRKAYIISNYTKPKTKRK